MWHYVGDHHCDGDISAMSDVEIELSAEWDGPNGAFVAACICTGWIDRDSDGTRVHDWLEWTPDYIRKRHSRRAKKKHGVNSRLDVRRAAQISEPCPPRGASIPPHTTPPHTTTARAASAAVVDKPRRGGTEQTRTWDEAFQATHGGSTYPWVFPKDGALIAKAFKALQSDQGRFRRALDRYFADPDPFYVGHPVAKFASQVARWDDGAAVKPEPESAFDQFARDLNRKRKAAT